MSDSSVRRDVHKIHRKLLNCLSLSRHSVSFTVKIVYFERGLSRTREVLSEGFLSVPRASSGVCQCAACSNCTPRTSEGHIRTSCFFKGGLEGDK